MNKYFNGIMYGLLVTGTAWAGNPIFLLTPNVMGPSQLTAGQNGTAIYQLLNNTNQNLNNIAILNLPTGATQILNGGNQYCTSSLNLAAGASCMIKIQTNSNTPINILGGPKVCVPANKPIYCSQPLSINQLATQVTPGPVSSTCQGNISNFNYELTQVVDTTPVDDYWGPARAQLLISPANPDLRSCPTTDLNNTTSLQWMENRVLAAEDFWVKQKLNYCHHHVPDWQTPAFVHGTPRDQLAADGFTGGVCSYLPDLMPGTAYYNQNVRWNYNGKGSETSQNWQNNNLRWYGLDCTDFTAYIYNFSFGIQFNSDTGYQAGQATNGSQDTLYPNAQTSLNQLQPYDNSNPFSPAGILVCKDGKTEYEEPNCGGIGTNGYFSVFLYPNSNPNPNKPDPTPSNITDDMLNNLKPGDLIYLGFSGNDGNNPTSMVTHGITWTGKKIGYGANDVNPALIAPESICPQSEWEPVIGQWVIIDSTYQGPDYRMFTHCFYQDHIWGVRRVIGFMHS